MYIPEVGIGSEFGWADLQFRWNSYKTILSQPNILTFSNGRAALRHAIRVAYAQASSQKNKFLLPAYLCHSMVQPFVEEGVPFEFYRVTEKLHLDIDDIKQRIDSKTIGVLLVHYFGFSQPPHVLEMLKKYHKLFIIEDSTHNWLSSTAPFGDVTIASPRKMLPIPDLAWLSLNSNHARNSSDLVPIANGIDVQFAVSRGLALALRGLYFRWPFDFIKNWGFSLFQIADERLDESISIRRASLFSRKLFKRMPLDHYSKKRRENYSVLLSGISELIHISPLFPCLPNEVVPLGFPILIEDRDWVRAKLIDAKIYPPIHWHLPKEIDIRKFTLSAEIASNILTIPIDQRYGLEHMLYIINCLRKIDQELKGTAKRKVYVD